MKAPKSENKEFFLIPEGEHKAILVSIIDLGTQTVNSAEFGPKEMRRVRLTWELPEVKHVFSEEKGEQPAFISQEYTFSMHEKANLRKHIQLMLGKPLKDEEAEEFDVATLLGNAFYLTVAHNESKDSTFANVFNLRKGDFELKAENPIFEFSLDVFDKNTFDTLGEKTQEKIRKSPEYQALDLNAPSEKTDPTTNKKFDSEFPF